VMNGTKPARPCARRLAKRAAIRLISSHQH
jgi:hypothetical protein